MAGILLESVIGAASVDTEEAELSEFEGTGCAADGDGIIEVSQVMGCPRASEISS